MLGTNIPIQNPLGIPIQRIIKEHKKCTFYLKNISLLEHAKNETSYYQIKSKGLIKDNFNLKLF